MRINQIRANCGGKRKGCNFKGFDLMKGKTFETQKNVHRTTNKKHTHQSN